jgi:hypothetical protein
MKTFSLTIAIAVFLLYCFSGIQAQTPQTKLDQLKLIQEFVATISTMQHVISKDTVEVTEIQQYGNAFVQNMYRVVNGKKSFSHGMAWVYSPKEDKFKCFWFRPNGTYSTYIGSFTSEKKFGMDRVQNFNPEIVLGKVEMSMETPTSYTNIFYNLKGVKTGEYIWTKVK